MKHSPLVIYCHILLIASAISLNIIDCPDKSKKCVNLHAPSIVPPTNYLFHFDGEEHPWLQNASAVPNIPLGEAVRTRLQQFSVMNKFKKKALIVSLIL